MNFYEPRNSVRSVDGNTGSEPNMIRFIGPGVSLHYEKARSLFLPDDTPSASLDAFQCRAGASSEVCSIVTDSPGRGVISLGIHPRDRLSVCRIRRFECASLTKPDTPCICPRQDTGAISLSYIRLRLDDSTIHSSCNTVFSTVRHESFYSSESIHFFCHFFRRLSSLLSKFTYR